LAFDVAKDGDRLFQARGIANDADVLAHGLAQAVDERAARARAVAVDGGYRLQIGACGGAAIASKMANVGRDACGEHHGLEQRVGGEPVGAVQAGRGHLADRPQAGNARAAACIGGDAAHVIMRGRRNRNELARRVDAGFAAQCIYRRELGREALADRHAAIKERAAAGGNF
jgi:hypothetical protein